MEDKKLLNRMLKFDEKAYPDGDTPASEPVEPQDSWRTTLENDAFYNAEQDWKAEEKSGRPTGTRPLLKIEAKAILNPLRGVLATAKDKYATLSAKGARTAAERIKQQYLIEHWTPAVETLARLASAEEILGSKDLLDELDELASVSTNASGYTRQWLVSWHTEDPMPLKSDACVREAIMHIKQLYSNFDVAIAKGEAERVKKLVDNGDNIASSDDYALLQKVIYSNS